jgi:hypothetical protein
VVQCLPRNHEREGRGEKERRREEEAVVTPCKAPDSIKKKKTFLKGQKRNNLKNKKVRK